jgi:glycosyltransferase involved in cell wall biosynthesis
MDIGWVTSEIEASPRSGGALRTHRLVREASKFHRVRLFVVGGVDDPDAVCASTGALRVDPLPTPSNPLAVRRQSLQRRWPLYFSRVWTDEARAVVDAEAASGSYIVLDHLHMWIYRPPAGRYALSLHNVESQLLADLPFPKQPLRLAERLWDKWAVGFQERKAIADERADVIVVSAEDGRRLGARSTVVKNGADVGRSFTPPPRKGLVLYVGSMNYLPNQLAVRWWAHEVWPVLGPGVPPLTVVGRAGRASLRDLEGHPGVDVVGEVESVEGFLERASLVAVPLQHGGGTRLKVLEALAANRPVVTTSKGAEGLPLTDRRNALLADTPHAFARSILELWRDEALANELAAGGRLFVADFAWPKVAEPLLKLFAHAAAGEG